MEPELPAAPGRPPSGHSSTPFWALGVLILLACFVLQYVWFNQAQLARYQALRPYLTWLCDQAGCELPRRSDLTLLELENRFVRTHPSAKNALRVDAIIVNRAPFEQIYPIVHLTLLDLDGAPVASRGFLPSEYLPGELLGEPMVPDQPVGITLELRDPGGVSGFEFTFR